jgi:hypothetical protein
VLPDSLIRCTRDFGAVPIREIEDQTSVFPKVNRETAIGDSNKGLAAGGFGNSGTHIVQSPASCPKMINFPSNGGHRRAESPTCRALILKWGLGAI